MKRIFFLFSLLVTTAAHAEIVGWRHDGTGEFPAADPPTMWTADSGVIWKTRMPGPSNASPILVGNKIFVCSDPDILLCVNREDGSILWERTNSALDLVDESTRAQYEKEWEEGKKARDRHSEAKSKLRNAKGRAREEGVETSDEIDALSKTVGSLKEELESFPTFHKYVPPEHHGVNGHSTPTPVSDGKHVFAVFGTTVVVCYDLDGNKVWTRFMETTVHRFGHSASPLLVGDLLIVPLKDLVALDAATGEEKWRTEFSLYWGSPISIEFGGTKAIVTPRGDVVRASDGQVLASELSILKYCSPVLDENSLYFIENGGKAMEIPSTADGEFQEKWTTQPRSDRYYASPVVHDGLIYAMTQNNVFSVIDQHSGEIVYSETLSLGGGAAYPSITLAGGYVYASNSNGATAVLKPGREYVEVASNSLEKFRSNPIFDGSRMYVRGEEHFYCIGE
jgi:outer membrane protein assembly factor BamB